MSLFPFGSKHMFRLSSAINRSRNDSELFLIHVGSADCSSFRLWVSIVLHSQVYNLFPSELFAGFPQNVCLQLKSPARTKGDCLNDCMSWLISIVLIELLGFL